MSKYKSVKTRSSDGILHDSKKEAERWEELLLLQRAGKIRELKRQVRYILIPTQYETIERYGQKGQRLKDQVRMVERPCIYIADFVYHKDSGELVVEDCKGVRTPGYTIKRKLMLQVYGIRILET